MFIEGVIRYKEPSEWKALEREQYFERWMCESVNVMRSANKSNISRHCFVPATRSLKNVPSLIETRG